MRPLLRTGPAALAPLGAGLDDSTGCAVFVFALPLAFGVGRVGLAGEETSGTTAAAAGAALRFDFGATGEDF